MIELIVLITLSFFGLASYLKQRFVLNKIFRDMYSDGEAIRMVIKEEYFRCNAYLFQKEFKNLTPKFQAELTQWLASHPSFLLDNK